MTALTTPRRLLALLADPPQPDRFPHHNGRAAEVIADWMEQIAVEFAPWWRSCAAEMRGYGARSVDADDRDEALFKEALLEGTVGLARGDIEAMRSPEHEIGDYADWRREEMKEGG